MIEIKKYENDFFDSFVTLINKSFNIKNIDKKGLITWKFFSNKNHENNKIICSYFNNQIIGQYSNIAYDFGYKNNLISGYLCQDMCILQEFRGQGLISKMSSYLYNQIENKTFTIGFSNAEGVKVDKNSKGYGYNIIDNFKSIYLLNYYSKTNITYEKIIDIDDIDKNIFSGFNIFNEKLKLFKNYEYLKWRYFDKPNNNYNFYLLKQNGINIGYVVFRFSRGIGVVFDFNFSKEISKKEIKNILKKIAFKNKTLFLKFQLIYNDYWEKFFGKIIFKKNENIYFTLKNHNGFDTIDNLNKNNWIILTGDIL